MIMIFRKCAASIAIFIFLSCAASARADCIDPAGGDGHIKYNSAQSVMQYCNGADWISFPKTSSGCSGIAPWTPVTWDTAHEWVTGAYGHAGFVIRSWAGPNRTMISPDGYNWTVVAGDTESYSMTYGNGLYVGVDYSGPTHIQTSPDAMNWTQHAAPEDNAWQDVAYGGGLFVAVAQNGAHRIMTSGNGTSWALREAGTDVAYKGVIYGDGKYVAVGHGNRVAYSEDGTSWDQYSIPYSTWESIAYGNGRFVAVSIWNSPYMAVSTDGINWAAHTPPSTSNGWSKVIFANGVFVAVASQGPDDRTMYSTDGLNWTPMPAVQDCAWSGLVNGDDRFIALCRNGGADRIMVAECGGTGCTNPNRLAGALAFNIDHRVLQWCDGTEWQAAGPVDPGGPDTGCTAPVRAMGTIAFNSDHCILQYCDGSTWQGIGDLNPCACDPNAAIWTTHSIGEIGQWRGIAYGNGTFVAMAHRPATSSDGINWTVQSGSPAGNISGSIAFGNNLFVVPSQGGWTRDVWTSPDGVNWTTHNNALPPSAPDLGAMIFDGNQFVAVGGAGAIITSPDGVNWTEQTSSVTTGFTDIAYGNGRYVAVGGWGVSSHPVVTSTDAVNWTAVPSASVFNSRWNSVAYGNGVFVAKSYGGGPHFMYSSDGENWQTGNSGTYGTWWGGEFISFGDGLFVVAGAVGGNPSDQTIHTSSDGINWVLNAGPGQAVIKRATYANGMFVGVNDGPSDMTVRATCLGGS